MKVVWTQGLPLNGGWPLVLTLIFFFLGGAWPMRMKLGWFAGWVFGFGFGFEVWF